MFKRSPTKNDNLQKHIRDEFKRELTLILDCKTRWNSLLAMLERFDKLVNCIRKNLIDIHSSLSIAEDEIITLKSVISALQPIKVAVAALCRRDIDLYVADLTLTFMLDEINSQNTSLSVELKDELIHRIMERRNNYSDVYQYLNDPTNVSKTSGEENYRIFNTTSKTSLNRKIVELIEIRSSEIELESDTENISDDSILEDEDVLVTPQPTPAPPISMSEKLQKLINEKLNKPFHEANCPRKGIFLK